MSKPVTFHLTDDMQYVLEHLYYGEGKLMHNADTGRVQFRSADWSQDFRVSWKTVEVLLRENLIRETRVVPRKDAAKFRHYIISRRGLGMLDLMN